MEDQPGIALTECTKCKKALCVRCSYHGLCQLCHRISMRESEGVGPQSAYEVPPDPNASSKPAQSLQQPLNQANIPLTSSTAHTCARCKTSGSGRILCMTCDTYCCMRCGDPTVSLPYRRCAFCPPPVGGDISHRRSEEPKRPVAKLNECCICRCACPTGPDFASEPGVPCALMGSEYGHCFRCCRLTCFDCSIDSAANCFNGELLCIRCRPQRIAEVMTMRHSPELLINTDDAVNKAASSMVVTLLAHTFFDGVAIPEDTPEEWVAHSLQNAALH